MAIESSSNIQLVSLAGVLGITYQGRYTEADLRTMTSTPYPVRYENLRRISLLLENTHTEYMRVYLGSDFGTSYIHLPAGAVLQIDKDFPWCGPVWVDSPVSNGDLNWCEISVQ